MRDSFVFYRSFYEAIKNLSQKNQLEIYSALANYSLNGIEPKLTGANRSVFELIKPQINANITKYENGKKGGRPGKNKSKETEQKPKQNLDKTKTKPKETKAEPNVNVNVNDNVNIDRQTEINNKNNNNNCVREVVNELVNHLQADCSDVGIDWVYFYGGNEYRAKTAELIIKTLAEIFKDNELFEEPQKMTAEVFAKLFNKADLIFEAEDPRAYLLKIWNKEVGNAL